MLVSVCFYKMKYAEDDHTLYQVKLCLLLTMDNLRLYGVQVKLEDF